MSAALRLAGLLILLIALFSVEFSSAVRLGSLLTRYQSLTTTTTRRTLTTTKPKRFQLSGLALSYSRGVSQCQTIGGQLAIIENKQQHEQMKQMLGTEWGWIGMSKKPNDVWRWSNGKAVGENGAFTAWTPGQPTSTSGVERCGGYKDGMWEDTLCSNFRKAACELLY